MDPDKHKSYIPKCPESAEFCASQNLVNGPVRMLYTAYSIYT